MPFFVCQLFRWRRFLPISIFAAFFSVNFRVPFVLFLAHRAKKNSEEAFACPAP